MSFAGIVTFKKNLDTLMDSTAFKNADEGDRLKMGGCLLRSEFGAPIIGPTKELVPKIDKK